MQCFWKRYIVSVKLLKRDLGASWHSVRESMDLTAQRRRIGHIALVELHVFFREVGGVHQRARRAEVEVDVQIEFLRGGKGAEVTVFRRQNQCQPELLN